MKLGYLASFSNPDEVMKVVDEGKFECLELRSVNALTGDTNEAHQAREKAKKLLNAHNIIVASILGSLPSLRTPKEEMKAALKKVAEMMDVCREMDNAVYTCAGPLGYDPKKKLADNVALYKEVYAPIAELAAEKKVRIGFENWPAQLFGEGGNLSATPQSWELMFNALPSDFIGLEFDPSHLMWQWIDPYQAAKDFAKHLFMVHLKDTEIFYDKLKRVGNHGGGWWTYRLPGFGELDWHKFFTVLYNAGYKGNMVIEHEDPVFSRDRWAEGLYLSGNFLKKVRLHEIG